VATGTGDLAIEAVRIGVSKITGIDTSEKCLRSGDERSEPEILKMS